MFFHVLFFPLRVHQNLYFVAAFLLYFFPSNINNVQQSNKSTQAVSIFIFLISHFNVIISLYLYTNAIALLTLSVEKSNVLLQSTNYNNDFSREQLKVLVLANLLLSTQMELQHRSVV